MSVLRSMFIVRVHVPGLDFQTYEILKTIPRSTKLLFVTLAGFVCGFSLLIP